MTPRIRHRGILFTLCFLTGWSLSLLTGPSNVDAQEFRTESDVSVIQRKLEWVVSDMGRLIEEMRRVGRLEARGYMVEDVEDILYRDVEFPLVYQTNARKVVSGQETEAVLPEGFAKDADRTHLAELFAKAYALAGLARSYEGFPAAAQDYLKIAKEYYSDVENLQVRIDGFAPPRALRDWIQDARRDVGPPPVRVTFYGKAISQEVADNLSRENIRFESTRNDLDYIFTVSARDFLKGMRRRLVTDDPITRGRAGWFRIYLPPGQYVIVTGAAPEYASRITVDNDPEKNRFFVETAGAGVTIFTIPSLETYIPGRRNTVVLPEQKGPPNGGEGNGGTDAKK